MSHRDNQSNNYKRKNDNEYSKRNESDLDDILRNEGNKRLKEIQTDRPKQQYRSNDNRNNNYRDNNNNNNNNRSNDKDNNKKKSNDSFDYSNYKFGKKEEENDDKPKIPKEKPDFKPSGSLKNDNGGSGNGNEDHDDNGEPKIKLKWNEPNEARISTENWVLYPFKEDKPLDSIYLHRKKSFLFGRNRDIVDIPIDHPSCSSQHAVLVFRSVKKENPDTGVVKNLVLPYIIDLESTNGTFFNGKRLEASRYLELRAKDVLKFGNSTREYVLLREDSIEENSSSSESED